MDRVRKCAGLRLLDERFGSGDGEQKTTMNTTDQPRAVACIRFVRHWLWPIAAISAPMAMIWPWCGAVCLASAIADAIARRVEFNAQMREMDHLWIHDQKVKKRELLERLEGRPNVV